MTDSARLQAVIDKSGIVEVVTDSFCSRDAGDWKRLVRCFRPDARITTSWFDGTAREFGEQSSAMMAGHHPTDTQRHVIGNPRVALKGARAVCEYYLILYQGRTLDGHEFDFQTWSVVLDLFDGSGGDWRIAKRMIIYEKDRMDPHVPGSVPPSYYAGLDLSGYPAAIRFHCYRNEKSSGQRPKNIIVKGTPEEAAARKAADDWLAGA